MSTFLFLLAHIYILCCFAQYLPNYWNDTYSMPGIYDIRSQERTYHIAYWDDFQSMDSSYKYPVIYSLHGGGGTAEGHSRQTGLHIDANKDGFLIIYPEGYYGSSNTSRTWNAGNCCGAAAAWGADDASFLLDILTDIETTRNILHIDRNRIFFTGHSNGGYMSWRMACEYPLNVTGIAPNDGTPGFADGADCDTYCVNPNITDITCWDSTALNNDCNINNWYTNLPSEYQCIMGADTRVVPTLSFWGYLDEHTIWNGGAGHDFLSTTQNNGRPTPPMLYIAQWEAMLAECNDWDRDINEILNILDQSRISGINDDNMITFYNSIDGTDNSTCISYSGCSSNIIFCTAWWGAHSWSGGHYSVAYCDEDDPSFSNFGCYSLYVPVVGNLAMSLPTNQLMLDFFKDLTLGKTTTTLPSTTFIPTSTSSDTPATTTKTSTLTDLTSSSGQASTMQETLPPHDDGDSAIIQSASFVLLTCILFLVVQV